VLAQTIQPNKRVRPAKQGLPATRIFSRDTHHNMPIDIFKSRVVYIYPIKINVILSEAPHLSA